MRGSARFASNDGTGELIVEIGGSNGGSQPNYKVRDLIFVFIFCFSRINFSKKRWWIPTTHRTPSSTAASRSSSSGRKVKRVDNVKPSKKDIFSRVSLASD